MDSNQINWAQLESSELETLQRTPSGLWNATSKKNPDDSIKARGSGSSAKIAYSKFIETVEFLKQNNRW